MIVQRHTTDYDSDLSDTELREVWHLFREDWKRRFRGDGFLCSLSMGGVIEHSSSDKSWLGIFADCYYLAWATSVLK